MNLQDEITRLIADIEYEIDECRKQESKASAKADHLIQMKLKLEKCIHDSIQPQAIDGSLLPKTAYKNVLNPHALTAMEAMKEMSP